MGTTAAATHCRYGCCQPLPSSNLQASSLHMLTVVGCCSVRDVSQDEIKAFRAEKKAKRNTDGPADCSDVLTRYSTRTVPDPGDCINACRPVQYFFGYPFVGPSRCIHALCIALQASLWLQEHARIARKAQDHFRLVVPSLLGFTMRI